MTAAAHDDGPWADFQPQAQPRQPQRPMATNTIDAVDATGPWSDYQRQPQATAPAAPAPAAAPAPRPQRSTLHELGRQVGLAARYGLEGTAQAAQILTEPIRQNITDPAAQALGFKAGRPLSEAASAAADALGLPQPETATERVVGEASRLVAGAGLTMGAGGAASSLPGMAGKAGGVLAAQPMQQGVSAAGAGLAGGAARENGADPTVQAGAALLGGIGSSMATDAAMRLGRGVLQPLMLQRAAKVDDQMARVLADVDLDWAAVPEQIRNGMRSEVEKAIRSGQDLDADALRRLIDFKRVGATPTRGTLTLDPVHITRERNLAKIGANATDEGLQGLARVEHDNNRRLIDALNTAGANTADDAVGVGQKAIGALQRSLDDDKTRVGELYNLARDSAGRSFPLDGSTFTRTANQALDDALLGHALPPSVATHMNRIARGEVPFTVDYAEQLKTAMGNLRRATQDGQTRLALDKVRQALDDTPVLGLGQQTAAPGARAVNPGNLPAVPGAPDLGEDAIRAFNQARAANRAMMQRIERTPALKAIYHGEATPDDFVRKFVIGSSAKVDDTVRLGRELARDPDTLQAVRGNIVAWLKDRALGGAADETARFSATRYRTGLAGIGDRKLRVFFDKEEIEQLKAVGRVASYTQAQPAGSAVNNSNSGALMVGRGLDVLDALGAKVPFLGIGPQVTAITRGVQQKQALDTVPVLVKRARLAEKVPRLAPAAAYGGSVAAPGLNEGEDDQRP